MFFSCGVVQLLNKFVIKDFEGSVRKVVSVPLLELIGEQYLLSKLISLLDGC